LRSVQPNSPLKDLRRSRKMQGPARIFAFPIERRLHDLNECQKLADVRGCRSSLFDDNQSMALRQRRGFGFAREFPDDGFRHRLFPLLVLAQNRGK
jgi:hypothetical protein